MIENYAEEVAALPDEPEEVHFATVGEVFEDGLSLIFPGSETPSKKRYKCCTIVKFEPGQRVHVMKDSGTYVVMYPIGEPSTGSAASASSASSADSAARADRATLADRATQADRATSATSANTATTASTATGIKNTGTSYSDIQLRAANSNKLEYRVGSGTWYAVQNQ